MSMFINNAFVDRDTQTTRQFYDAWSYTYDADITSQGYATPARCAEALAAHVEDKSAPVLDFGCGTGLFGQALVQTGFTQIDGVDISSSMLERARAKSIYRHLNHIDENETPAGGYSLISAVGVIGNGAAPISAFDILMHALPRGGKFVFSFNDFVLADSTQAGRLNEWIDCSAARVLFAEYGPHLPEQNMKSTVYLVEKY